MEKSQSIAMFLVFYYILYLALFSDFPKKFWVPSKGQESGANLTRIFPVSAPTCASNAVWPQKINNARIKKIARIIGSNNCYWLFLRL
jgi:hypothetical protein